MPAPLRLPVLALAAALSVGCAGAAPRSAHPDVAPTDVLSAQELEMLERGEHVARPSTFDRAGGRYVGGVAYQIVEAPPHVVLGAVRDPALLKRILPRTRSVTELAGAGPQRFAVEQGNDWVQAEYTVILEELPTENEVRFFLDDSAPHDVEDVYGYFRVKAIRGGRTLVSMGVAIDLGPGLIRMLFEERVQQVMLETPRLMRDVVERESTRRLLAQRTY